MCQHHQHLAKGVCQSTLWQPSCVRIGQIVVALVEWQPEQRSYWQQPACHLPVITVAWNGGFKF